ncbi:MAG: DUF3656 domain-containing protein [Planctomycetota bacterium]|nr:DUF3656 domain-containing protein [Planctomycetota bacterium]MDA1178303.1 DUF3656 domain-containing protein [Planctomycetota bacterium]
MAELLSPAGDWDCLCAAVENGADAVYFGLDVGMNARARATNFSVSQLPNVMQYLHQRGVKGYVTLNTLVFSAELPTAEEHIRWLTANHVDALLVQDLGLTRLARAIAPDLPLHASTQMTLTSAPCIEKARELGISRVVLPRELSIREIARVHRETSIELEAFVHGALCVAYSGQCLTSESLGGRSANRGQCAQACRLPYTLFCDGEERDLGSQQFLLSPQDLAGFDLIPDLLQAGVGCLKIEGRLKSAEYVANITRHYRRALDEAQCGGRALYSADDIRAMEMSFSRGFSPGWLRGCDHKMLVPALSSAKRGSLLGLVAGICGQRVLVTLSAPVRLGDGVGFDLPFADRPQQGSRVYEIFHRQQSLREATDSQQVELGFAYGGIDLSQIHVGQPVWKTDDPVLNKSLRKTFQSSQPQRRVDIDVVVTAVVGEPLCVVAQTVTGSRVQVISDGVLSRADKHPVTDAFLREQLGRLGNSIYRLRDVSLHQQGAPLVPLSVVGQVRKKLIALLDATELPRSSPRMAPGNTLASLRSAMIVPDPLVYHAVPRLSLLCRTLEQLQAVVELGIQGRVYADFQDIREYGAATSYARKKQCEIFLATPRIQKPDERGIFRAFLRHAADGVLVRNLAGLDFFVSRGERVVADYSLNAANDLTVDLLQQWGAEFITPSYDLNREQLLALLEQVDTNRLEMVIHQHMPMFHMEHCVFCAVLSPGTNKTNCGRPCDRHVVELQDRVGMRHPLQADVGCRNTLYNAQAQSAAEVLPTLVDHGVRHFRLELLQESAQEASHVVQTYLRLLDGEISGSQVLRQLNAMNRVGVTRGTLEHERNPLAIL